MPANDQSPQSNAQFASEFKARTKRFAVRALKLGDSLPQSVSGQVVAKQLARSATSVAANYRAACRARSTREFAAKLHIALEEADESELWIELLNEAGIVRAERLTDLQQEAREIVAILTTSERNVRRKIQLSQSA